MSTTVPASAVRAAAQRRAGRLAVTALFALMTVLLLAALLVPLLASPGSDWTPRPMPAPAPALPR